MDIPFQNCLSDFDLDFLDQASSSNRTPVAQSALARKKGIARLKNRLKSVSQVVIKAKETAEVLEELQKESQDIKSELEETKNLLFEKNEENTVICNERNTFYNQATEYANELQAIKEKLQKFEQMEYAVKIKDDALQVYSEQMKGLRVEVDSLMDTKSKNDKGTALAVLRANKSKEMIERKLARVLREYVYPSIKKPDRWLQCLFKKYINTSISGYQEEHSADEIIDHFMMSPMSLDHQDDENAKIDKVSAVADDTATNSTKPKYLDPQLNSPPLNRNIIDLECVESVDTGRGSSLAFSDGEKSFNSPEYYVHDSPFNTLCNRCNKPKKDATTSPIIIDICDTTDKSLTNLSKEHSITTKDAYSSPVPLVMLDVATDTGDISFKKDAYSSPVPLVMLDVATDTADISFEILTLKERVDASTSPQKCGTKVPINIKDNQDRACDSEVDSTKLLDIANYDSPTTPLKLRDKLYNIVEVENNINRVEAPVLVTSIVYESDESQTNDSSITSHESPTTPNKVRDKEVLKNNDEVVRNSLERIGRPTEDNMSLQESKTNRSTLASHQLPTTHENLLDRAISNIYTEKIVRSNVDVPNSQTNDLVMSDREDHSCVSSYQSPTTTTVKLKDTEETLNNVHNNQVKNSTPLETEDYIELSLDCMSTSSREQTPTPNKPLNKVDEVYKHASTDKDLNEDLSEDYDENSIDNYAIFNEEVPTYFKKPIEETRSYERHVYKSPQVKECLESNNSKHFSSEADTDNEIQSILSEMRLRHQLLTPIPTTPSRRNTNTPQFINELNEKLPLFTQDVNELINTARNKMKDAFGTFSHLADYCKRVTEVLIGNEANREVFRTFCMRSPEEACSTPNDNLRLPVIQPKESILEKSNVNLVNDTVDTDYVILEVLENNEQISRINDNYKTHEIRNEVFCEKIKEKHSHQQIHKAASNCEKNMDIVESSHTSYINDLNVKSAKVSLNKDDNMHQKHLQSNDRVEERENNNSENKNICVNSHNKTLTTKTKKLTKLEKLRRKLVPHSKIRSDINRKPRFKPLPISNYTRNVDQQIKPKEADTSASLNEESVYQNAVKIATALCLVGPKKVPKVVVEDCSVTMNISPRLRVSVKELEEKLQKSSTTTEKAKEIKNKKRNLLKEFETVAEVAKHIEIIKPSPDKLEPQSIKRKRSANISIESEDAVKGSNENDTSLSPEINKRKKIKISKRASPKTVENLITLKDLGVQPERTEKIEPRIRKISSSTENSVESTIGNKSPDYKINNNNNDTSNRECSRLELNIDDTIESEDSVNQIGGKRRSSRLKSHDKTKDNAIDFSEIIYKPGNRKNHTPTKDSSYLNDMGISRNLRSSNVKRMSSHGQIEHNIAANNVQSSPRKTRGQNSESDMQTEQMNTVTGPVGHSTVVSYDDLSLFTNNDDCPQYDREHNVIREQNGKTDVEVSVNSYSSSILCRSLEKYGRLKINYVSKKFPENKVKELYGELESSITRIVALKHDECTKAAKKLADDIKGWDVKSFLVVFMRFMRDPQRKLELHKKQTFPTIPSMTKTEQILLYVMHELQDCDDYRCIVEKVLMNIEYALFALNKNAADCDVVEVMSRFYALVCRSYQRLTKLRLFMLDAMYCMQFKSIIVIKQCLEVWMFALPLAHLADAKTPLISCVVFLLHFFKCDDKNDRVREIRLILKRKYSYDFHDWNEPKILELFKSAITELKNNPLDKKMLRIALVILAKRNGPKWCQENIVKNMLKPIIEDSSTSTVARLFCLSVLGPLFKPYPNNMKVHTEMITDYLLTMLKQTHCEKTREAIVSSLICFSNQDNRVLEFLVNWHPKNISPEFELVLRDFVRTKPIKVWKTILSKMDY